MRLLVLTCLVATSVLAGPVFTDLAPTTFPSPRRSSGLVIRGQGAAEVLIAFGGFNGGASPLADLPWYTVSGNTWASATSTSSGRERHGLAYDPVRDRLVMFGGANGLTVLGTLTLINGATYAQTTPGVATGAPSNRLDPLIEYIPPWGKFLVFGGRTNVFSNQFAGDNFSLDISDGGVTWAPVTSATSPSARGATCHAWDPVHAVVLMFGGEAMSNQSDTWSFSPDGGGWKSLTVTGTPPTARAFAACAWDPVANRFVLYGGQGATNQLGGLYTFDPATNVWTQQTVVTPNPGTLSDSAAVYSEYLGGIVLFGGNDGTTYSSKTWLLKFNSPPVVDAGAAFSVNEGAMTALSGSVTDPDGDATTVSWAQTLGPAVTLSSTTVLAPTFTAPRVFADSTLRFVLTGSDPTSSASATVNVTVLNSINEAPVADAGPDQAVMGGATVTLSGSGSDPNNDPIVSSGWTQVFGPAVVLSSTSVPTPTFTAPVSSQGAVLEFQLVVNDGNLSSPPDAVVVTVAPAVVDAGVGVGVLDAGTPDAGAGGQDAGVRDSGVPEPGDAGTQDGGVEPPDAGTSLDGGADGGGMDAGVIDLDAGAVDQDAGMMDAGISDGGAVDAGPVGPPRTYAVGCGCDVGAVPVAGLWLVAAWAFRRRRR